MRVRIQDTVNNNEDRMRTQRGAGQSKNFSNTDGNDGNLSVVGDSGRVPHLNSST